jgi:hypothetical protein
MGFGRQIAENTYSTFVYNILTDVCVELRERIQNTDGIRNYAAGNPNWS